MKRFGPIVVMVTHLWVAWCCLYLTSLALNEHAILPILFTSVMGVYSAGKIVEIQEEYFRLFGPPTESRI